jgi:hypothetical protein
MYTAHSKCLHTAVSLFFCGFYVIVHYALCLGCLCLGCFCGRNGICLGLAGREVECLDGTTGAGLLALAAHLALLGIDVGEVVLK